MQNIFIKGAKTHNLKNIDVEIPRNKLIVVTGVSGSGKSSLSIDTLYAEGQRRYIESLSSYARQFLERMNKPDIEYIKGLCPAIAIEQKVVSSSNRSTVGTLTEIFDYLRLLYARIGMTYSPISNTLVKKEEVQDVLDYILSIPPEGKCFIGFQVKIDKSIKTLLESYLSKGFQRVYVERTFMKIEEIIDNPKQIPKSAKELFIVVQRIVRSKSVDEETKREIADSIQTAFEENLQECDIFDLDNTQTRTFNNKFEADGLLFEIPSPQFFNFNNSYGACTNCEGFGSVVGIDEDLVVPDKTKSFFDEAVAPWRSTKMSEFYKRFLAQAEKNNFPIHKPYLELTNDQKKLLWEGNKHTEGINDFFKMVESNFYKIEYRILFSRYRGRTICKECHGTRIRKDASFVKINNKSIDELLSMQILDLKYYFDELVISDTEQQIAKRILLEITNRLKFMLDVGLGYLTLNRVASSLSGGESQRINLTKTLGSNLSDSLYILDEPSIGLHPKDTTKLINVLKQLRDLGNTVVVVEHEEEIMKSSDYIIDIGPKAGVHGGELVFHGNFKDIHKAKNSLTTQYLMGDTKIARSKPNDIFRKYIEIKGAMHHNLKNIDVKFPLDAITVVSGVSGSGKTTLIKKILYPSLMFQLGQFIDKPGTHRSIEGDYRSLQFVEMIDQNPLGRSSRSNPVTYVKAFDFVRDLFASQPLAKQRKFQSKEFSFNVPGGRCESCKGDGIQLISMQFLADIELECEDCKGKRYKDEVLEVTYREKNIFEVLDMTIDDAIVFFEDKKSIYDRIKPLSDIGLGYLKLGQSSSTLSGGEAQRVKLASYLNKSNASNHGLFIFDEPTTGLHFYDVQKLLYAMERLVEMGHSVMIIEHNMDIIRNADWIIDLGPEGGDLGGKLLYQGPIKDFHKARESYTAKFL